MTDTHKNKNKTSLKRPAGRLYFTLIIFPIQTKIISISAGLTRGEKNLVFQTEPAVRGTSAPDQSLEEPLDPFSRTNEHFYTTEPWRQKLKDRINYSDTLKETFKVYSQFDTNSIEESERALNKAKRDNITSTSISSGEYGPNFSSAVRWRRLIFENYLK